MKEQFKQFCSGDFIYIESFDSKGNLVPVLVVNDYLKSLRVMDIKDYNDISPLFDSVALLDSFESFKKKYPYEDIDFKWDVISWFSPTDYKSVLGRVVHYKKSVPVLFDSNIGLVSRSFGKLFKESKDIVYVEELSLHSESFPIRNSKGLYQVNASAGKYSRSFLEEKLERALAIQYVVNKIKSEKSLKSFDPNKVVVVKRLPKDPKYYEGGVYSWNAFEIGSKNHEVIIDDLKKKHDSLLSLCSALDSSNEEKEILIQEKNIQINLLTKQVEELVSKNRNLSKYIEGGM